MTVKRPELKRPRVDRQRTEYNKLKDNVFNTGIPAFDFLCENQAGYVMEICTERLKEGEERGDELIGHHAFR